MVIYSRIAKITYKELKTLRSRGYEVDEPKISMLRKEARLRFLFIAESSYEGNDFLE
jgi:hypothetical protein